ncbi:Caspase-1 [Channa argus]|uniref:Caspase-1 n=1 Tax=Channa argus TaxID=215402 RepID=A0A6G1QMX4_CHAAH|nr:Caspase-1 [Channa argus]
MSLQVRAQHLDSKYIKAPSKCKLFKDQNYSVHCPTAYIIQPEEEDFDLEFGPNYHPTFEIRLPIKIKEVTITVRDRKKAHVWKRVVDLTGPGSAETLSRKPEKKLKFVRKQFIDSVSEPVICKLLDTLLDYGVITEDEMEKIAGTENRAEKARVLIDTVRKKGSKASSCLISAVFEEDSCLSKRLELK